MSRSRCAPQSIRWFVALPVLSMILLVAGGPPASPAQEGDPPATIAWSEIGGPELLVREGERWAPLPMLQAAVELDVSGVMLTGRVRQRFSNTTGEVIEAVYAFPLPERAAVHRMELRIGSRRILSRCEEREEARRTYERAREAGRKAGLVEQHRPNLFRLSVANINPGETIDVDLEFVQEVDLRDGVYSLRMPLTYTPRYDPRRSGNGPRARAGAPAAPRVSLTARVEVGVPLEDVRSDSHDLATRWEGETWVVQPEDTPVIADRDFVLSWKPRFDAEPRASLLVERGQHGARGLLIAVPHDLDETALRPVATATLFVVDVSGSMQGLSIRKAREALGRALDRLGPGDRFGLLAFSDEARVFRPGLVPASREAVAGAQRWVARLKADGGTRIHAALVRALDAMAADDPRAGESRRIVFLTDGAVANEVQVLEEIRSRLGDARIHAIGIGSAPNTYLMREMSAVGRGFCAFLSERDDTSNRIDGFFRRIDRPAVTDLELHWDGRPPEEVHPARLPDLYPGEPLVASVAFGAGPLPERVRMTGRAGGEPVSVDVHVTPAERSDGALSVRWARAKVGALIDSLREGADADAVRERVVRLAKRFHLVTRYTSLVAVEEIVSAEGPATTHRVVSAAPHGRPISLGRGGTARPLLRRLAAGSAGVALLVVALLWWTRRGAAG
jgi:Ca-activated chloride channel family protein